MLNMLKCKICSKKLTGYKKKFCGDINSIKKIGQKEFMNYVKKDIRNDSVQYVKLCFFQSG